MGIRRFPESDHFDLIQTQLLVEDITNALINTTATTTETVSVTLPPGWRKMDVLFKGIVLVTPTVATAVRTKFWLEYPSATVVGLEQGSAMSGNTNFYDSTPLMALVQNVAVTQNVLLRGQITSGANGECNADNRQLIAIKYRRA